MSEISDTATLIKLSSQGTYFLAKGSVKAILYLYQTIKKLQAANVLGKGEVEEFEKFLKEAGVHNLDELYIKVGYGKMEPKHLIDKLVPKSEALVAKKEEASFMEKLVSSATQKLKKNKS